MEINETTSTRKSERYELRFTVEQKEMITQAARISGKDVADFILENALLASQTQILDQRVFAASGKEFLWWEQILESESKGIEVSD